MHVREWGSEAGRPLVFWHALGSGTSGAYLTEVAPALTAAGLWLLALARTDAMLERCSGDSVR